jgi:hypothetical protein
LLRRISSDGFTTIALESKNGFVGMSFKSSRRPLRRAR